jgi:phosphatidate cytidylyltransferase
MNVLIKRSITGLVFALIMILGLSWNMWSALFLLGIILTGSAIEWNQNFSGKNPIQAFLNSIYGVMVLICLGALSFFTFFRSFLDSWILNAILISCLSFSISAGLILKNSKRHNPPVFNIYTCFLYVCLPVLTIGLFYIHDFGITKSWVLFVVVVNWANDTFAYLTGKYLGKNKLAYNISPGKTIEGAVGGILMAIISGILINENLIRLTPQLNMPQVCLLCLTITLFGILGDLFESYLKRRAGIKDSGSILPGHGGFLDRFDSFFFSVPAGIFVLWIIFNS